MRRKTILALMCCIVFALVGCQSSTSEVEATVDAGAWQCRSAPDIHLRLVDYTDEFAFCEISVGSDVGSVAMSVIGFANMVNDGRWQRVPTTEPILLPPPPNWDNFKKEGTGIRIDGSDAVQMFVHVPLPVHDQITITEAISYGK